MGGTSSICYAVPVTQKKQGQSSIYRFPDFKDKLIDRPDQHILTLKDVFMNSYKKYSQFPALGTIIKKEKDSEISYITYKDAIDSAQYIGTSIINQRLYNIPEGEKMKMIGIFAKNRAEWTIVDISASLYNFTIIPIYDTLGDENISYVLRHAELTSCFVSEGALNSLMKCQDLVFITTLICYDDFTPEQNKYFGDKGIELIKFQNLLAQGKDYPIDYHQAQYKVEPNDCVTFSYTSGTTGPPKGAMLSHRNFTSFVAASVVNKDCNFSSDDVAISYLPLPHILERQFVYAMLAAGARVVFYFGDVQKLKDDLAIVKPTLFLSVPRLYSRFYQVLKSKFNELQGLTKTGINYALQTKLENLAATGNYRHRVYDKIFFAKTRQALGGRVRLMVSGSAPLLPEVQNFLKVCMCAPLCEGYGQTESTGAMLITDGDDPQVRHVGGPISNFEIKLVDIPEMNYLSTDKDKDGNPTPRGEIWCRGPGVFLGYYHDDVKTKQAITQDGWLRTGDVGAMSAKTKSISVIDRKKNIFKLQQGQYVAAEKVENTYLKGEKLAQIFIHGQSTECFVIAIAVPHHKYVEEIAASKNIEGNYQQLCSHEIIRGEFINYLNKIGKEAGLMGFEQVKNIYLESESFLMRGILTNTMKIQRHQAKKLYKKTIENLYLEGMLKVDKK